MAAYDELAKKKTEELTALEIVVLTAPIVKQHTRTGTQIARAMDAAEELARLTSRLSAVRELAQLWRQSGRDLEADELEAVLRLEER